MESSYMKLYKNIANKKNKIKHSKSRQNSTQQLKKNKSLTYYHFDGQINYINKMHIQDLKINDNKTLSNNNNANNNNNYNQSLIFSNHEYNDFLLFNAYKKSVLELFKMLKIYMNNELYKYNKIKREFLCNIQKFYDEEKRKENNSKNKNKTPLNYNIKSYSKKKIKEKNLKSKCKNQDNNSELYKNNSGYRTSMTKLMNKNPNINIYDKIVKSYKYSNSRKSNQIKDNSLKNKTNILYNNNSMNRTNISGITFIQNNNNINFNSFHNHKSLYTILKKNKKILVNSPLKNVCNQRNDNIMKKFIIFSKDISKNKNCINKTCSQSIITNNKLLKEEKNENIKNNENSKNNELISKIKDSLDDNLKHIFNFSYESFLNKESERECN